MTWFSMLLCLTLLVVTPLTLEAASPRPPIVRLPNPPSPPSNPATMRPPSGTTSVCTTAQVNSTLAAAQASLNAKLAAVAPSSNVTSKSKTIWDDKGPLDVCTWEGTKTTKNSQANFNQIQLSLLNASDVSCTAASKSSYNFGGNVTLGITFTKTLTFQHQLTWEAKWCPEMGGPSVNKQVLNLAGSMTGLSAVATAYLTATVNTTHVCVTSVQVSAMTIQYTDATVTLVLIDLGTFDVSDKFNQAVEGQIPQIEYKLTTDLDNIGHSSAACIKYPVSRSPPPPKSG